MDDSPGTMQCVMHSWHSISSIFSSAGDADHACLPGKIPAARLRKTLDVVKNCVVRQLKAEGSSDVPIVRTPSSQFHPRSQL